MKPLELAISGFGPFKGEVNVPFEKIGESGLFLISGDTGAGKTTIFDAIAFALFGCASGENRTTDSMRSDYATGDDKTYVKLVFSHKGRRYEVERNPLYQRAKKRGDGFTEEKPNATLIKWDGSVVAGYQPVTNEIMEILSIDYKQFKQIAMIAQGEFMKLLTASSEERGVIFRKVFQTGNYEAMQKKLKSMASELRGECDQLERSMVQYLSGILLSKENEVLEEWKRKPDIHKINDLLELLELDLEEDKSRYDTLEVENKELSGKLVELTTKITLVEEQEKKKQELEQRRLLLEDLRKQSEQIKLNQIDLQNAKKALYQVKPVADAYHKSRVETENLVREIIEQKKRFDIVSEETKKKQAEYHEHEKDKARLEELAIAINQCKEELAQFENLKQLEIKIQSNLKNQDAIVSNEKKIEEQGKLLKGDHSELTKELQGYLSIDQEILECIQIGKDLKSKITKLKSLLDELNRIELESSNLKVLQQEYFKKENSYQTANKEYQTLELAYFREQAGLLAMNLKGEEPCPVCGSTKHPKKAECSKEAPTEAMLNQAKVKLESETVVLNQQSLSVSNQNTKISLMWDNLCVVCEELFEESFGKDKIKDRITEELSRSEEAFLQKNEEYRVLKKNQERRDWCNKRTTEISAALEENVQNIQNLNQEKIAIATVLGQMEGSREQILERRKYATKEECENKHTALLLESNQLRSNLERLEKEFHELRSQWSALKAVIEDNEIKEAKQKVTLEEEEKAYQRKLTETSFDSEESYLACLWTEDKIEQTQKMIEDYEKQVSEQHLMIEKLVNEIKETDSVDIQILKDSRDEINAQKSVCERQKEEVNRRIRNNDQIYKDAKKQLEAKGEIQRKYLSINELSKTANGELTGKVKIAFEQYVQAFYFDTVIEEANKRLRKMTFSQYTLHRADSVNLRSQGGLEIFVLDHYTGKQRTVKSLSGGESFKAALALALGLSDVIQSYAGGIELDSMFIDEGFGSLDSESLEQAIETLISLTSGNRLVGIISHVTELKERIDKKILIHKTMEGSYIK
ncbi:AAA family ATPase [Lachnoclostridium phytofermentans]|uniref:Nuclease SbcCD subunit C n=1 Tax=Lachnoclostridium phytofermentans (strain ATCC 700394 / DSM 18823 / ISDg) TaxID=357809 RepID=A9KNM3_LACP7|nr:SMC family ATPase [Lachnoclostridium phytofermentans]ABX41624.1 SMC domain protein [Lachnoclostridium phytofermentans ISDg]